MTYTDEQIISYIKSKGFGIVTITSLSYKNDFIIVNFTDSNNEKVSRIVTYYILNDFIIQEREDKLDKII